jgi:hypothetical protein
MVYRVDDYIFLSSNIEYYFSPFLQNQVVINVIKGLIMIKVKKPKNLPKNLLLFIAIVLYIMIFIIEVDFDK